MEPAVKILGVILLCSAVFQLSQTAPSFTKSAVCGKYNCPKYRVESKNNNYEVRVYEGGDAWIHTTYTDNMFANYILFRRLFNYINGANEQVSKFNMTVPVLMKTEDNKKTMMFYLGRGVFPKPTQQEVKLQTTKEHKVYVRGYESFWFFGEQMNGNKLKNALENDNAKFKSNYYYSVGYSRPMYFRKTYKEVWFTAKDADI